MRSVDALIVGGGPAGSTCAWKLRQSGLDVLVLDKAAFPRLKLCAGWVTPKALQDLELAPADYPHGLLTFETLRLHWGPLSIRHASRQYSIRRWEFDEFLLRRSGVDVVEHKVREIRRDGGDFVIDGGFRTKYLLGAGGTSCPVYRALFRERNPRDGTLQAATLEHEFEYDWQDPECHLWFFSDGLPGYAWYVPKAGGHVNIGLGGMAGALGGGERKLRDYWDLFTRRLSKLGLVQACTGSPKGYSYYLRGQVDRVRVGNAFLAGDAAGLATRDMCEGIGPAIESGLRAARAIADDTDYTLADIAPSSGRGFVSRALERRFAGSSLAE
ncbi:MAG: NAD(P)/FAD-dependent oxidoreductase [Xanthomonadales bacterium]|nr:NAD(P)/FAD-dependent oxidoreductase [Xanthomonadales bacterium]